MLMDGKNIGQPTPAIYDQNHPDVEDDKQSQMVIGHDPNKVVFSSGEE